MEELEQPKQTEIQNCASSQNFEGEQNKANGLSENKVHKETCSSDEQDCNGSNTYLGKFNSVQDLMDAYNSLQAEFTRKCQRLKLMEEKIDNNKIKSDAQNEEPVYLKQDYQQELSNFLNSFPLAKKYAKEISLEVANNNINLEQAYNNVLAKQYKEPEELVNDKDFIENYVLSNENIKKELIKKYLKDVKESNAPTLITGASGMFSGRAKDIEISSLEEANKLALKMFRE